MRSSKDSSRRRQNLAYGLGAGLGLLALALLGLPSLERLHARGPMMPGHEDIACDDCHEPAPGTARQQLQAGVRYLAGLRTQPPDFGRVAVGNDACLACHERPNDRHPVYRFLEPRFAPARQAIAPQNCLSCHAEHQGRRVTQTDMGYCQHCHKNTKLRKDPVDVPHERLIALKQWTSCLGCHDFHGNHVHRVATRVEGIVQPDRIREYFAGGASPYGAVIRHVARKGGRHGT